MIIFTELLLGVIPSDIVIIKSSLGGKSFILGLVEGIIQYITKYHLYEDIPGKSQLDLNNRTIMLLLVFDSWKFGIV